ncbi:MAG: hypothetical protein HZC41_12680 [Chloroflexi bacterium]|nr:hypothetical protein [Chloroflexota bacterium]
MLDPVLERQILDELRRLDADQQRRVLDFARELSEADRPRGVPAERVFRAAAGLFSKEEVDEMMKAIEEECERIDYDEW